MGTTVAQLLDDVALALRGYPDVTVHHLDLDQDDDRRRACVSLTVYYDDPRGCST